MDLLYLDSVCLFLAVPKALAAVRVSLWWSKGYSVPVRGLLTAAASVAEKLLAGKGFSSRSLWLSACSTGLAACWHVGPFQIRD